MRRQKKRQLHYARIHSPCQTGPSQGKSHHLKLLIALHVNYPPSESREQILITDPSGLTFEYPDINIEL